MLVLTGRLGKIKVQMVNIQMKMEFEILTFMHMQFSFY